VHPYVCGANRLFKPVRDNWPLRKIRELDPKSFMLEAEAPEALEPFPDVVSPYIGDVLVQNISILTAISCVVVTWPS
jgi:hypothetical protein